MAIVFQKTKGLTDKETHYCPGCTHGIIHRLVAECLEELGVLGDAIGLIVYQVQSDGSLEGAWTISGKDGSGTEILTPQ